MNAKDNLEAEAAAMMCCASCGVAEVDDIKLKECDACDLVRYCSDKCQQDHRPYHDASCKERATELREEVLFRQPESTHLGDCPICLLPLSRQGCAYANTLYMIFRVSRNVLGSWKCFWEFPSLAIQRIPLYKRFT